MGNDNCIWVIEKKEGKVSYGIAKHAFDQIEASTQVIKNQGRFNMKKCIVAETFDHIVIEFLKKKKIVHLNLNNDKNEPDYRHIVNAVKNLTDR